ncbi:MAG: DNA repair protein RecN [Candidatus Obscuribacterales bacterium]|nr:DNA repair protein RecN [Candidatus Obscuribacterales bacterium]
MLEELEIRDFALVEQARIPFSWGLNVLTGETGAGKSIIMDALNVVLGGKAGPTVIRAQASRATIEANFKQTPEVTAWLKQQELLDEESTGFSVSREINKTGSKCRINGTLVNVSLVQELRQVLVTVHAQHEFRTLLSAQSQLTMLDALGDDAHHKLLAKIRTLYARHKDLESQLKEILISEEERAKRLDFARFQHNELEEAHLADGQEDESLLNQHKVLANVTELESMISLALGHLRGGEEEQQSIGAVDLLQRALAEIAKASELDQNLQSIENALAECVEQIEDQSREIRRYNDSLDSDPETLSSIDERLALLATIKRKYGPTLDEAMQKQQSLSEEIDRLENSQTAVIQLENELNKIKEELQGVAQELSAKRRTLAQKLAKRIQDELAELGMENCRFDIALNEEQIGSLGADRVEFLMAPNPGQPFLPVAKIASGGELSRVMLAVKTIFAGADGVATVIFDEIDSGLSGRVLQSMRDKLARLAKAHQILCITHQPIIAAVADNHIFVAKEQGKDSTQTKVSILDQAGRLQALAEMASGQGNQEAALKFAKSLFDESSRLKA